MPDGKVWEHSFQFFGCGYVALEGGVEELELARIDELGWWLLRLFLDPWPTLCVDRCLLPPALLGKGSAGRGKIPIVVLHLPCDEEARCSGYRLLRYAFNGHEVRSDLHIGVSAAGVGEARKQSRDYLHR